MERIKIETGVKKYEIEDENGDLLGIISIDPKDMNLFARCETAESKISELLNNAIEIAEKEPEEKAEKMIVAIDEQIKEQFNYVFDYDVSSVVFGNRHCLNMNHGVSFAERFLDMIFPVIKNAVEQENKESKKRVSKYTDKYQKVVK